MVVSNFPFAIQNMKIRKFHRIIFFHIFLQHYKLFGTVVMNRIPVLYFAFFRILLIIQSVHYIQGKKNQIHWKFITAIKLLLQFNTSEYKFLFIWYASIYTHNSCDIQVKVMALQLNDEMQLIWISKISVFSDSLCKIHCSKHCLFFSSFLLFYLLSFLD